MSVDFTIRDFFAPLAILRLRRFFERSQWLPRAALVRYQEERLRTILDQAYQHVPYYRDLFRRLGLTPSDIRGLADLRKLPTLSKPTLRAEFDRLRAANQRRFSPRLYQTSGTSSEPVRFLLDKPANVLEFVYYWRHWSWAGYRLGTPFAELASSWFLKDDERARLPFYYQRLFGRLLLNSISLSAGGVAVYAQALRRYRPRYLKGVASALYYLAIFFQQHGVADIRFQGIFSTGELLLPSQRALIEQVFGGKVHDSYGHMERTVAISECPHGRLHINLEYGILELIDKKPVPAAEATTVQPGKTVFQARVVGTSLHNLSMPLVRYEVGDVVEFEEPEEPCPCGRTLPHIRRILGRQEDVVITPDGRVITTLFIVFDQIQGVSLGQVVQELLDRLVLRVVRSADYTDQSEANLLGYVRRYVGPEMRVEVEYLSAETLRRQTVGKFRTVVSRLPPREAGRAPALPVGATQGAHVP